MQYLHQRRQALGGYLPHREPQAPPLPAPPEELFDEFYAGTDEREVSTTMVFVRILSKLLRDKQLGKLLVPIVPDEARTFGMETLFRQVGIYSSLGQLYEPVEPREPALLPRGHRRPGARRGHHRGGLVLQLHRRRHRLCHPRHQRHSVLHLLLDVRLPARRRPDLGSRRHAREGVLPRRHRGAHHPERRGPAAPGWPQPRRGAQHPQPEGVRPGLRVRAGGDHPRRHRAHVREAGESVLLPDRDERELRHAGDAGGVRGGHPARHLPAGALVRRRGQAARATCSAAAPS